MVNDTTMNVTERDSTIQVADTVWNNCAAADSTKIPASAGMTKEDASAGMTKEDASAGMTKDSASVDSIAALANCTTEPTVTMRDSVIKLIDTTYTITQKPAPSEIVLKGSPLPRIEKHIELESREFAGTERDYKPIPTVPLFIPMLAFYENAPDLTVFGDGQLKAKIGLAAIIADPLKKNTLQIGLMLEIGNGIDYINGSGLNPEQEKEFFVAWENRSTPIDFGISYTYASYTSKDTVRYEDVRANDGDSLGISNYAVPMQSIVAMAGYSPFKSVDTLQIAASYDWADFNLYEDNFAWTYQKRFSVMALFGLYGDSEGEDGTGISGQGDGAVISYQYSNSDLYRPGTFAESFVVTESGKIKPKYRNFNIHEFGLSLYGSIQSPLTGARLAAGAKLGGIFNWDTDAKDSTGAKVDTLDSYYYSAVFLEGYPYLRSSENYTRAGTKTAMAEVHYLFPVYDDWRKGFWIFETRAFYIDAFAQICILLLPGDQALNALSRKGILIDVRVDRTLCSKKIDTLSAVCPDPVYTGADNMNHSFLCLRHILINPGQKEVGGIAGKQDLCRACIDQVAHGIAHLLYQFIFFDMLQISKYPAWHGTAVIYDDPRTVPFLFGRKYFRILFEKLDRGIRTHSSENADHKIIFHCLLSSFFFFALAAARFFFLLRINSS